MTTETQQAHDGTHEAPDGNEVRDRVVLPFVIPVAALGVIAVFVGAFAAVLTWVGTDVAVAVAGVVAANILLVGWLTSKRQPSPVTTKLAAGMGAVVLAAGVGAIMALGVEPAPEGVPGIPGVPRPGVEGIAISAESIAFDSDEIRLTAGEEAVIFFTNNDPATPHDIAIYTDSTLAEVVFDGDLVTGPASITYRFTAPESPGEYYFHCTVHPGMNGSVIVE